MEDYSYSDDRLILRCNAQLKILRMCDYTFFRMPGSSVGSSRGYIMVLGEIREA